MPTLLNRRANVPSNQDIAEKQKFLEIGAILSFKFMLRFHQDLYLSIF